MALAAMCRLRDLLQGDVRPPKDVFAAALRALPQSEGYTTDSVWADRVGWVRMLERDIRRDCDILNRGGVRSHYFF